MRNALALHTLELCAQAAYFFADQAAIHFQLRFARAATRANPAALTLKVGPHPCKPARQVLQPGQLHLKLALPAFGPKSEDIQNQRNPIKDPAVELLLKIALLGRGQRLIEQYRVDVRSEEHTSELQSL